MRLDLSPDDVELLRGVLEAVVSDLSPEIAHTDNALYRRGLAAQRDHLRALLERLGQSVISARS